MSMHTDVTDGDFKASIVDVAKAEAGRIRGIKVVRTRVRGSSADPSPDQPLTIRQNILRDALVRTLAVPSQGADAVGSRLQLLLGMGLRRDGDQAPGRGRGFRNGLLDALDVALAFTLQRAFVPPSAVVALLLENRSTIDKLWALSMQSKRAVLTVEIDSLSQAGRDGIRTGRFSEDPRGTLKMAEGRVQSQGASSLPAPQITIDLTEIYRVTIKNLRWAGVPSADLKTAGRLIATASQSLEGH